MMQGSDSHDSISAKALDQPSSRPHAAASQAIVATHLRDSNFSVGAASRASPASVGHYWTRRHASSRVSPREGRMPLHVSAMMRFRCFPSTMSRWRSTVRSDWIVRRISCISGWSQRR